MSARWGTQDGLAGSWALSLVLAVLILAALTCTPTP